MSDLRGPTPICPEPLFSLDLALPISALFGSIWIRENYITVHHSPDPNSTYEEKFLDFTIKLRHLVKNYLVPLHLPDLAQELAMRYFILLL